MAQRRPRNNNVHRVVRRDFRIQANLKSRRPAWRRLVPRRRALISVVAAATMASTWYIVEAFTDTAAPAAGELSLIDDSPAVHFELCGMTRHSCVVDGDTFWLDGQKIRIADIDTPEISEPKCAFEYDLGMKATYRLRDLLNAGAFEIQSIADREEDRYGRKLRVIMRDGQSLGDQLVREGLARPWTGRRRPWC